MFRYCVSNRGKEKLIHNGYVYARKYTAKDKHVWKCYGKNESKKPCTATVKLDPNSLNIIEKGKHNHSSDVDEHLKNSQKHVKKRISKINSALKQIYNWKLSQMENKISEDDELKHYATPAHNEVYTYMANVLKLDSSFLITTDVKNIMEIVEVPEMKSVLHNEYCKLQNCPISKEIVLLDHPIFELCIKLLENYKKLHLKHPYVENLITRDYLVEDTKWFLREANVVGEQKTEFLYIMRHTNLGLMGHRPYKRECECGEDCSQNPIHSLNDYMYTTIGSILPVFADNPNAQRLFARRKICRLGRFKDALEFKRYYFSNEINICDENTITHACNCSSSSSTIRLHLTCRWIMSNELLGKSDLDDFINKSDKKVWTCPNGLPICAIDWLHFLKRNKKTFAERKAEELAENKIYFTYCCRIRVFLQTIIICQTKHKILAGDFLYLGMDYRRYFEYIRDPKLVERVIAKHSN